MACAVEAVGVTKVLGFEAHKDERASHKRKVVSSNLTAATNIGVVLELDAET